MPEFLTTTTNITGRIENIISQAKETVFLITPFLSFVPQSIIDRVEDAIERGVKVVMINKLGTSIHANEIAKLKKLKGMTILSHEHLHAKAYFNEHEAVVTSFNLSQGNEVKNVEFGIYFNKTDSEEMFNKLLNESRMVQKQSKKVVVDPVSMSMKEVVEAPVLQVKPKPVDTNRVLSVIEKQECIKEIFSTICPDCSVKNEEAERLRIERRGIVLFTNAERVDIIFDNTKKYQLKKDEIEKSILLKHPNLNVWFNNNRINIYVSTKVEVVALFHSFREVLTSHNV
jgi:HKD family nuclease